MEAGIFKTENDKVLTNQNLIVSFLPSNTIENYTYVVYKDNDIIERNTSNTQKVFNLKETGTYYIKVTAPTLTGTVEAKSKEYVIDKEKPKITVKEENLIINKNIKEEVENNVLASDNFNGVTVTSNLNEINLKTNQKSIITYTAVDKAGNTAIKKINIQMQDSSYIFALECLIGAILLIVMYYVFNIISGLKIEKKIANYTVKGSSEDKNSLSEKFISKYQKITKKLSKNLDKSVFITKYAKKLDKYIPVSHLHKTGFEIFGGKIITAAIFVIIALISKLLSFKMIYDYEAVLIFTIGFFALDILYFIKYKIFRWKIESDFIAAITIMNNAFKSGRSITQAIDTVSKELKGPIGREFDRMSLELLYGLGIDVVFKRFAKRIQLEEANYLTASLTILNKTGGDIIKVFSSIERNMYDKRKLRLEMASLTSGSKIVVTVLLGMPFFFCLVINIINPDYFLPFFTTNIGIILLIFMIIYYIIFVVVVRKVMKVVI